MSERTTRALMFLGLCACAVLLVIAASYLIAGNWLAATDNLQTAVLFALLYRVTDLELRLKALGRRVPEDGFNLDLKLELVPVGQNPFAPPVGPAAPETKRPN